MVLTSKWRNYIFKEALYEAKLKNEILNEAYRLTKYAIHPRSVKMYHDLNHQYCWLRMKKDVALYIERCLNFQ